MLKRDSKFRRLKYGGRSSTGSSASYWLGGDHLFVVEVSNYNERYRRFYFRDIQALIIQRNRQRMWSNIIAGFLAGLLVLATAALLMDGETDGAIFFGCFAVLSLAGIWINTVRGPTCAVYLRTAVQTQKLTGIVRWKKAGAFVEELSPFIQASQSSPSPAPEPTAP
jgi:hypothetical protein